MFLIVRESQRRVKVFRGDRPPLEEVIEGKDCLVVDDGIATGATMKITFEIILIN